MSRLIDIAERAGVSLGTVSAVLSGRRSSIRFSRSKAEEIRSLAKEMNYIPNFSAKSLNRQATMSLGVLIDSEDADVRFLQLSSIEREADRLGYRILIAETHNNPEKQLNNYRILRQYGVDGVICHANSFHPDMDPADKLVLYGAEPLPGYATVYYDIGIGYRQALAQFRAEKRRSVGLAITSGRQHYESVRARLRAFSALMPGHEDFIYGLPPWSLDTAHIRLNVARMIEEFILPRNIDALILQNDFWALALAAELPRYGLETPRDLSFVGQDNLSFGLCGRPALSTIESNRDGLAKEVVRLMLDRIETPDAPIASRSVDTWFVPRETTLVLEGATT